MTTRRTTPPVTEVITLAQAKAHLRVDIADDDGYISTLVVASRMDCEDIIQRTIAPSGLTLTLDSFPASLLLDYPPVISVTSIAYIDSDGIPQTLDPQDYIVDTVSEPGYIVPAPGKAWPATQDRINTVTVAYTAGYPLAPAPLVQWMLLAIGTMYENRSSTVMERGMVSTQLGIVDRLLDPYRIYA